MKSYLIFFSVILSIIYIPNTIGQSSGAQRQDYAELELEGGVSMMDGPVRAWITYDEYTALTTGSVRISGIASTPPVATGTLTYTWTITNLVSCSASAVTTQSSVTAFASSSGAFALLSMASSRCNGIFNLLISHSTLGTIANWPFSFNIQAIITVENGGILNIDMVDDTIADSALTLAIPTEIDVDLTDDTTADSAITLSGTVNTPTDILDDSIDDNRLSTNESVQFFIDDVEQNQTFNLFNDPPEYKKAVWIFLLFIGLTLIAEYKKDVIYHLLAAIVGIFAISQINTQLGIPLIATISIMFYNIMRLYKVSKKNVLGD